MTTKDAVKRGLLLLGSFAIAYNASEFLHELGHALAAWMTGGQVSGIVVHPFNWSFCYAVSPYPLFLTAAGVMFSSLAGVLIFVCLIRWPKPFLLPLLLIGPLTLINNGDYMLMDLIVQSGGDACSLAAMGISPAVIVPGALFLLLAGFALAVILIRKIGLLEGGFTMRLIIIGMGILSYLTTALVWIFFNDRSSVPESIAYTLSATLLAVLFAAIARPPKKHEPPHDAVVGWKLIVALNLSAVILIAFLLNGPIYGTHIQFNIETFSERPDDFPSILVPPVYAEEVFYMPAPNHPYYLLSYDVPLSTSSDEVIEYLRNLHREQGYIRLTHLSEDPACERHSEWQEYGIVKGLEQEWLSIEDPILRSVPAIMLIYQEDALSSVRIMHSVKKGWDTEQMEAYITMHPEQFDLEQLDRLRQIIARNRQNNIDGQSSEENSEIDG